MSKAIPPVQKYMTPSPHTIGVEQTLSHASDVMRQFGIRHLPVLKGGQLTGMITDRDVAVIRGFKGVDAKEVLVEDAMSGVPYTVSPDSPVSEVAAEMAEKKYGSAIVVQNQKVVGVFTAVDACRVLAEVFNTRLK
jgi:acetoin utilization protein AcuB